MKQLFLIGLGLFFMIFIIGIGITACGCGSVADNSNAVAVPSLPSAEDAAVEASDTDASPPTVAYRHFKKVHDASTVADSETDSGVDSGTDSGVDSGTDSSVDSGVALRTLTVVWEGNPTGSYADRRYCAGSPMQYNDLRSDATATFKYWPDQDMSDPNTWKWFGGDVLFSTAKNTRVVKIYANTSLRFNCMDENGSTITYGCNPGNILPRVYEGGSELPLTTVANAGSGFNCQVK